MVAGVRQGEVLSRAAALGRDLANCPAAVLTATRRGEVAQELGEAAGLEEDVVGRDELVEMGCGGLLGVNLGAAGRLVMADALALAVELDVDAIVDIATLTGACLRALGVDLAGVMGNSTALVEQMRAAGEAVDEPVWPLPLHRPYRKKLDSPIADLTNLGGPNAGQITAAARSSSSPAPSRRRSTGTSARPGQLVLGATGEAGETGETVGRPKPSTKTLTVTVPAFSKRKATGSRRPAWTSTLRSTISRCSPPGYWRDTTPAPGTSIRTGRSAPSVPCRMTTCRA